MRIQIVSDLHLEHCHDIPDIKNNDADVLVLAGDIVGVPDLMPTHPAVGRMIQFFTLASQRFKHVIYVAGNHEHYASKFNETHDIIREFLTPCRNVSFLENEHIEIEGVAFFGATLWTDLNSGDPVTSKFVQEGLNDYNLIVDRHGKKITPIDTFATHLRSRVALKEFLKTVKKCVVITHHAPSFHSIHPRYRDEPWMNYGFYSEFEPYIKSNPQIALWIHGHVHDSFDYKIGETRVVCNPRGYPRPVFGLFENYNFDEKKVVDIDL